MDINLMKKKRVKRRKIEKNKYRPEKKRHAGATGKRLGLTF